MVVEAKRVRSGRSDLLIFSPRVDLWEPSVRFGRPRRLVLRAHTSNYKKLRREAEESRGSREEMSTNLGSLEVVRASSVGSVRQIESSSRSTLRFVQSASVEGEWYQRLPRQSIRDEWRSYLSVLLILRWPSQRNSPPSPSLVSFGKM